MEAEWKQMLQDSGINEDLELGMENGSGLKGQKYILNVITIFFLGSSGYYQYYQNVTNGDIIKLYEKFQPDFLSFGYTLDGFLNKD